jgi:para-aminobenzoate synthetase/4-amino-4-deoxychorismate lyase
MIADVDLSSPFALFDGDNGDALLLTAFRRPLRFAGDPEAAFAAAERAAEQGEWVALAADYELGACFEPAVPRFALERAPLRGWVFGRAQRLDKDDVEAFLSGLLTRLPEHERVAGVAEIMPALDSPEYAEKLAQVRCWIVEGDCYQINLTFPLTFRHFGHPLALYAALRRRQPVRYGAYITAPGETILSLSPELFFARAGARVVTRPMKGTAPRGSTPQEDEAKRRVAQPHQHATGVQHG